MSFGFNNKISNRYNYGLLLFALLGTAFFCFPFIILSSDDKSLYDTKRLFVILLAMLSAFACLVSEPYRDRMIRQIYAFSRPVKYLLVVICLSAIYANATGWYFLRAQTDFFYFIGLAILTLNLSLVIAGQRRINYAFYSLFVVFAFVSVAIGHLVAVFFLKEFPSSYSLINFTHPRMLNQLMIWTLLPTLYMAVICRRHAKRGWMAMIPLTLNFTIMFATDARGFGVASLGGIILWVSVDSYLRRIIIGKTVLAMIIGYLVKYIFLSPFPAYLVLGELADSFVVRTDSSGRIELWKQAINMASFLGHGGDAFVCNSILNARPHNSVLLMAVNWGMLAALSYIALLLYGLRYVVKADNRKIVLPGISMLSGFAYSLVSGVLDSPLSQLGAVLTIALFWGEIYRRYPQPNHANELTKLNLRWPHGLLVISAILFIGLVGYKVYLRIDNNFYRHIEQESYKPQFWLGQNCVDSAPKLRFKAD